MYIIILSVFPKKAPFVIFEKCLEGNYFENGKMIVRVQKSIINVNVRIKGIMF